MSSSIYTALYRAVFFVADWRCNEEWIYSYRIVGRAGCAGDC